MQQDLDAEKAKNDNLGLELINLVNENKALQSDSNGINRNHADMTEDHKRAVRKVEKLEKELRETQEALIVAKGEIERLKSELVRSDLKHQQN